MSKRAPQFERRERDLYTTPPGAVLPLKPYIKAHSEFYEPCAADGILADAIERYLFLRCIGRSDIHPMRDGVMKSDALTLQRGTPRRAYQFITNPPWERVLMHRLIDHLKWIAPTWMLLESDWLFTKQAAEFIPDATHIVAIGRIKWIEDSPGPGKDNACWVRFVGGHDQGPTFYPNW